MKSTKPKLNVRLLRRIKRHILAEPRRLRMGGFGYKLNKPSIQSSDPPCGTVGCIAGWAIWLTNPKLENLFSVNVIQGAINLIGVKKRHEWLSLFYVESWPEQFRTAYFNSKTAAERAKIAAERIEYLISTGQ